MAHHDRRRETRLPGSAVKFELDNPATGQPIPCKVTNLSRLGLGIDIEDQDLAHFHIPSPGSRVSGTLYTETDSLQAEAIVRVQRDRFLGLEYVTPGAAFVAKLITLLSPSYIGNSITPIAREYLAPEIEAAFHGEEFECIIFKPGKTRLTHMVQFFAKGAIVELMDEKAHFVPSPLVRGTGEGASFAFHTEFEGFNDDTSQKRLLAFFRWVSQILDAWEECPPLLREIVLKQKKKYGK